MSPEEMLAIVARSLSREDYRLVLTLDEVDTYINEGRDPSILYMLRARVTSFLVARLELLLFWLLNIAILGMSVSSIIGIALLISIAFLSAVKPLSVIA